MGASRYLSSLLLIPLFYWQSCHSVDCLDAQRQCQDTPGCIETSSSTHCSCNTDGLNDLYFSIPVHSSVETLPGWSWSQHIEFIKQIMGSSIKLSSGVGIQTYGRNATTILPITSLNGINANNGLTVTHSVIDNVVDNIKYSADSSNNLYHGMQTMKRQFQIRNQPKRQQIHVIFMTSNPTHGPRVSDIADVCFEAYKLKEQNIRSYIAAIGLQDSINFDRELIECIVEDPDTDVVYVDPTNTSHARQTLLDLLCVDEYQFKITEIKPTEPRFVELYNFGKDIPFNELSLSFTSLRSFGGENATEFGTNSMIIPQGEFFTFYDDVYGDDAPVDGLCEDQLCFNMTMEDFEDMNETEWIVTAHAGESYVEVAPTEEYWSNVGDEYSYELRALGYNTEYGLNWRQSCSVGGSINAPPDTTCSWSEGQCTDDSLCTMNGDVDGHCDSKRTFCECPTAGFGNDGIRCIPIPRPIECHGIFMKDPRTNQHILKFLWDRLPSDVGHYDFILKYESETGTSVVTTLFGENGYIATDFNDDIPKIEGNFGTVDVMFWGQDHKLYPLETGIQCLVEETFAPTAAPTASPVTPIPTTPSPTGTPFGVFLNGNGDFCDDERCECYGYNMDCCVSDDADDDGIECEEQMKLVDVPVSRNEGVKVRVFPNSLSMKTTVCYEIHSVATKEEESVNAAVNAYAVSPNPSMPKAAISNCIELDKDDFDGFAMEKVIGLDSVHWPFECDEEIVGKDECYTRCLEESMEFELEIVNCSSVENRECVIMYPQSLSIVVSRGDCYLYGTAMENELLSLSSQTIIWIVVIILIVLVMALVYVVYRIWLRRKQTRMMKGLVGRLYLDDTSQSDVSEGVDEKFGTGDIESAQSPQ